MLADADANVIKLDHNQFKNLDRFHEVELQVTVETMVKSISNTLLILSNIMVTLLND